MTFDGAGSGCLVSAGMSLPLMVSCLTLIIACVIYWQAKEISRVVRWYQPKEGEEKIDVTLLEHVSPIEWDNVILYGHYILDRAQIRR
jgi:hypothetical protein